MEPPLPAKLVRTGLGYKLSFIRQEELIRNILHNLRRDGGGLSEVVLASRPLSYRAESLASMRSLYRQYVSAEAHAFVLKHAVWTTDRKCDWEPIREWTISAEQLAAIQRGQDWGRKAFDTCCELTQTPHDALYLHVAYARHLIGAS